MYINKDLRLEIVIQTFVSKTLFKIATTKISKLKYGETELKPQFLEDILSRDPPQTRTPVRQCGWIAPKIAPLTHPYLHEHWGQHTLIPHEPTNTSQMWGPSTLFYANAVTSSANVKSWYQQHIWENQPTQNPPNGYSIRTMYT